VVKDGGAVVVKVDAKTGRRAVPAVAGGRKQGRGGTTGAMVAAAACSAKTPQMSEGLVASEKAARQGESPSVQTQHY